ncbi:MAG: acyl-[acyl-carrier-protein] thioesterase [Anaeroplasmataceae bacterium]
MIYTEENVLRTEDFDYHDVIKPSAILNLFQDIAGTHANMIGVGYKETLDLGMFWVLVRTYFEICAPFKPLSHVKVSTWPHEKGRIDCNREYIIEDMDGNLLARGISKWVVIDCNTRRISRTDKLSFNCPTYNEPYYSDVKKFSNPDDKLFKHVYTYKIMKRDLDHNLHTNNSIYADIVYEILDNIKIKEFQIEYIKETKKDDILEIYKYNEDDTIYFIGYSKDEKIFISKIIIEKGDLSD